MNIVDEVRDELKVLGTFDEVEVARVGAVVDPPLSTEPVVLAGNVEPPG